MNFDSHGDPQFGSLTDADYGALFGQGGWLQKVFQPGKFQTFLNEGGTPTTNVGSRFTYTPPPDLATTTGAGTTDSARGGFFERLFSAFRRDPSKVTARQNRRLAGRTVGDPETGGRYRINKDGSVTSFKVNAAGELVQGKRFGANTNTALRAKRLAKAQRAAAIVGGVGVAASLVPAILGIFGIGQGEEGPPPEQGPAPQPVQRPSNLVPIAIGGAALVIVTLLVAGKKSDGGSGRGRRAR